MAKSKKNGCILRESFTTRNGRIIHAKDYGKKAFTIWIGKSKKAKGSKSK